MTKTGETGETGVSTTFLLHDATAIAIADPMIKEFSRDSPVSPDSPVGASSKPEGWPAEPCTGLCPECPYWHYHGPDGGHRAYHCALELTDREQKTRRFWEMDAERWGVSVGTVSRDRALAIEAIGKRLDFGD